MKHWPDGYYPVFARSVVHSSETGRFEWRQGTMSITPQTGYLYESGEVLTADPIKTDPKTAAVAMLLAPGAYTLTFNHSEGTHQHVLSVPDPFNSLVQEPFRDGCPIYKRTAPSAGKNGWDAYVIRERPYRDIEIGQDDIVLDMGAHIGTFTRDAMAAGAAVVHCYEPDPVNLALLRTNIELSDKLALVTVHPACVVPDSHVGDTIDLWSPAIGTLGKSRFALDQSALHSIRYSRGRLAREVAAVKFNEAIASTQATAIKVDVESAELLYDWSAIALHVKQIAVELPNTVGDHPSSARAREIVDQLESQGFRGTPKVGRNTIGVWKR